MTFKFRHLIALFLDATFYSLLSHWQIHNITYHVSIPEINLSVHVVLLDHSFDNFLNPKLVCRRDANEKGRGRRRPTSFFENKVTLRDEKRKKSLLICIRPGRGGAHSRDRYIISGARCTYALFVVKHSRQMFIWLLYLTGFLFRETQYTLFLGRIIPCLCCMWCHLTSVCYTIDDGVNALVAAIVSFTDITC